MVVVIHFFTYNEIMDVTMCMDLLVDLNIYKEDCSVFFFCVCLICHNWHWHQIQNYSVLFLLSLMCHNWHWLWIQNWNQKQNLADLKIQEKDCRILIFDTSEILICYLAICSLWSKNKFVGSKHVVFIKITMSFLMKYLFSICLELLILFSG